MLENLVLEDDFTTKNQACGEGRCCEQSPAPESKKEMLYKINRKISVCLGCYNTDSWMGWLRQQEFISQSSEAGSPRSGCQLGQVQEAISTVEIGKAGKFTHSEPRSAWCLSDGW